MYRKILVPLDGSKHAESALQLGSKLARIHNAEITLLRVVEYPLDLYSSCDPAIFVNPGMPTDRLLAEKATFYKEAEAYLRYLAGLVEMSVSNVSVEIQECPVVEAILRTVSKAEIDLIVMSTIGRDRNPWMMGATTNRILREAPVPVILIRKESWMPLPDILGQRETSVQEDALIQPGALSYT